MVARLADIYSNTISQLCSRIMIKGDQAHLSNVDNAAKIRALLLAGIRAALLWRQAGGDRWKLIFSRLYHAKSSPAIIKSQLLSIQSVVGKIFAYSAPIEFTIREGITLCKISYV